MRLTSFHLDLFNNMHCPLVSASGTAFAGDLAAEPEDDVDPDPSRRRPAFRSRRRPCDVRVSASVGRTFIFRRSGLAKGWKDRARDNFDAIRLAAAISPMTAATPDDRSRSFASRIRPSDLPIWCSGDGRV